MCVCVCLQAASITELLSHAASHMQQAGSAAVALQAQLSIPFCRAVKVRAMGSLTLLILLLFQSVSQCNTLDMHLVLFFRGRCNSNAPALGDQLWGTSFG